MVVTHKAKMAGYYNKVFFCKRTIINIIAFSNIVQQYRVTYDIEDKMFIFHLEA